MNEKSMRIKILGSAGWEGIPVQFCNCRVCELAKKKSTSKDNRTRPEILVETKKGSFLIEISPDIRLQTTRFNLPNISNFLISHWHFDHMYGLLELGAWSKFIMRGKIKLYCSIKTKEWLDKNFAHITKEVVVLKPFVSFNLFDVRVTPIPIYHMNSQDENTREEELNNTFGFVLEEDKKKVVYLSDYYRLPKKSLEFINNSDILIADGTYLFEELFPDKPEQNGEKTDPDHLHGKQILDFAKKLGARKAVVNNITHLTEKTHDELQKLLPEGVLIAFDGMKVL